MDQKYTIDEEANKMFLNELTQNFLNFGKKFPSPEGSSYYLGDDSSPWRDRPRECWITCRMVHVYSIGKMLGFKEGKALAEAGLKGLKGELSDKKNGGFYPGITADGKILPTKQCYAHAFVILAASSALLAGIDGAKELLSEALDVYDKFFWDEDEGLARDTYNTEFTHCESYRGLNANMHTVEAFLAVADAIDDDKYRIRAGRIIDRVIAFAKDNDYRIPEHYTVDWKPDLLMNQDKPDDPFKPFGATPGHGIEWARLIVQWAKSTFKGSENDACEYIKVAQKLFDGAVNDAWNADGAKGIVYTTDWQGQPVVHDRMHWTLCEAINTSAVLYRVTGDKKYADYYADFMEYLDTTVLDHVNGSCFHQLDANNKLKETVWPGKSDIYHAFQATLIPYLDVDTSIAKAVLLLQ